MSRRTKTIIYKTIIKPVVTFGSETWVMSKADENKVVWIDVSVMDIIHLTIFLVVAVMLCKCYSFEISQQPMYPQWGSNLHFSKRMKKEITESDICLGRKCAALPLQNKSNNDYLINSVILCLIGLAIHLTVKHERQRAADESNRKAHVDGRASAAGFRRTAHSTSIACSSLSPSPVPRAERRSAQASRRTRHRQDGCKVPWDRMAKQSEYEVCLSLHPSPSSSEGSSCNRSILSYSSSSTSGLYPCIPPRRWRGNSKLNLAETPEVVPREVDLYYHL
ncbi:hypothetical protein GE061_001110 [Apolygus lucorum]|uniref:Uncharacterized protein n=1 Tax=Apolygus lucorum TaxID=248454 RepID=A0A8S9Y857_APOLU|nr:hypothetical protein GE061_001110 [Apolygus lucorum]